MMAIRVELVQIVNRVVIPVDAPARVLVVPWGEVESQAGNFEVDAGSAGAILAAFEAQGVMLPIDMEHQTVGGAYSSPDGSAPAMGWITALEVVESEGIYGRVEWTQDGAELVRSKKYRYFSPTLLIPRGTKKPRELHSVALTNKPAIVGMRPIVNRHEVKPNMDPKFDKARWFLNLEELATEEEILMKMDEFLTQLRGLAGAAEGADQAAIVSALKAKIEVNKVAGELRAAVCKAVGLEAKADDAAVVAAVGKLGEAKGGGSPNPAEFVPMSEHVKTGERVAALEGELLSLNAAKFIERGQGQGRISDAQVDVWEARYKADPVDAEKALLLVPGGVFPSPGRVVNRSGSSAGAASGGDQIVANADRFDGDRMEDYDRVTKHMEANKCSFAEAVDACGG